MKHIQIREEGNIESPNIGIITNNGYLEANFKTAIEAHFDAEVLSFDFVQNGITSLSDCISAYPIGVRVTIDQDGEQWEQEVEVSETWIYSTTTSLSDRCRELMEEAAQVIEKEVKRIGGISEDTHPELNFWGYRLNVENVGGISPDGKCTDGHLKGDDVREMMRDNDIQFSDWIELADDLKKIEA